MTEKPKHLKLVRSDPAKEERIAATLYRQYARRQVEEELRRQGVKTISMSFATFNEMIRDWLDDHPRPKS
jgi:hypothetical protein